MREKFRNIRRRSARNTFLPSHDSEEQSSHLQKHIQINQFLRAYLLQNAAMTSLQLSIVQDLQTPPHCPPPITLLQFQNQFQKLDRFPDQVFPQLRSLKREIRHNKHILQREQLREMEPLNWATGTRANRPFENITVQPIYTNENVHAFVPRRPMLDQQVEPTDYFKQQLYLARDPTGPDPYAHQPPTEIPRGVFKLWVFHLVTSVIMPLLDFAGNLINFFLIVLFFTVFWGLVWPVKVMSRLVAAAEWEMILAVILAAHVARWLPRLEGGMRGLGEIGNEGEKPLYTIMIPGRYALLAGSKFENSVL